MSRGSKPGERRGGRQRATPNKRTVLTDKILAVASAHPTASCDELVAILARDRALPASSRVAVARKWFAAAPLPSANGRSKKPDVLAFGAIERTTPIKPYRRAANATPQSTRSASPNASPATNVAVLPVLFSIAQDSATTGSERRQAASELAQYFLPKNPTKKKSRCGNFPPDEYGFVVDPDLARELRDTKLELACLPLSSNKRSPYATAQKASKLQARIKEIQQSLECPCPSKYKLKCHIDGGNFDAEISGEIIQDGEIVRDHDRLEILRKRRADKKMFTPEEDLEEAIRTARYDSFMLGPEMAVRLRLAELREKKRAADKGYSPPFTLAQKAAFRLLTLLYPPPQRSEPSEIILADHPFLDLPIAEHDNLSSLHPPKRPVSSSPNPNLEEDFVEFVEIPPFCTVDRELSAKKGRLVLKWTYEI
jgi:hypothetical protein